MATRILFFGLLKEAAGAGERLVDLPAEIDSIASLIDWLAGGDGALKAALETPSVRIAIDQSLVARGDNFATPREIAFMPPFSGG